MKNTSVHVSQANAPSKTEGIVLCSVFILTFVLVVAGNSLIIILFAMNRSCRKKHLFLLINMAFADLLLGTVTLPIYINHVGYVFQLWTSQIGDLEGRNIDPLTIFRLIFDTIFSQASLISAVFISCERFHAIFRPFKHQTLSTRAYDFVILTAWILGLLISAISTATYVLQLHQYFMFFWVPYILVLICIICGCNIGIWIKFRGGVSPPQPNRDLETKRNIRLTKTLLFVSSMALITWLPLIIANSISFWSFRIQQNVYHWINLFNFFNSFVNPVLYALRIAEFRKAVTCSCFLIQPIALNTSQRLRQAMAHYRYELTFRQRESMDTK